MLSDHAIGKVGHNLKYDLTLLKWHGIEVQGEIFDTMLAHSMKELMDLHLPRAVLGEPPSGAKELAQELRAFAVFNWTSFRHALENRC